MQGDVNRIQNSKNCMFNPVLNIGDDFGALKIDEFCGSWAHSGLVVELRTAGSLQLGLL